MKLTIGTIVAGELVENKSKFTVATNQRTEVTIGEMVYVLSSFKLDESSLWTLVNYLEDRPSLMDDAEVKGGVNAIKMLLDRK